LAVVEAELVAQLVPMIDQTTVDSLEWMDMMDISVLRELLLNMASESAMVAPDYLESSTEVVMVVTVEVTLVVVVTALFEVVETI
jgi:hypothetical protein